MNPPFELRILRCGDVIDRTRFIGGIYERTLPEPGWYRAEAWGSDGKPRVITNHVILP